MHSSLFPPEWGARFNIFSFPVFWPASFLPFCPGYAKQVKETSFTRTVFLPFPASLFVSSLSCLEKSAQALLWQMNFSLSLLVSFLLNLFCLARLGGTGRVF